MKSLKASASCSSWTMLMDDKQVIKLIPPKSCALLITSRKTIKIPGLFKKDLDVMKPDEALELLLNVCCPARAR